MTVRALRWISVVLAALAVLGADVGRLVLDRFAALARQSGRALLIVTQDPRVRRIGDRVLRMDSGVVEEENAAA